MTIYNVSLQIMFFSMINLDKYKLVIISLFLNKGLKIHGCPSWSIFAATLSSHIIFWLLKNNYYG